MAEGKKVTGIPEGEKFFQKAKRKAITAANWCKTHWKGIALGAVAIGGGAYMLSRNGDHHENESGPEVSATGGETVYEAIERTFTPSGDGSDIGPGDDEEDEVDKY